MYSLRIKVLLNSEIPPQLDKAERAELQSRHRSQPDRRWYAVAPMMAVTQANQQLFKKFFYITGSSGTVELITKTAGTSRLRDFKSENFRFVLDHKASGK
jgi:hypothetical protein